MKGSLRRKQVGLLRAHSPACQFENLFILDRSAIRISVALHCHQQFWPEESDRCVFACGETIAVDDGPPVLGASSLGFVE